MEWHAVFSVQCFLCVVFIVVVLGMESPPLTHIL